jgi:hypothetical protein
LQHRKVLDRFFPLRLVEVKLSQLERCLGIDSTAILFAKEF